MISGYLSHVKDNMWYQSLIKPSLNPPSLAFSFIWTILYIILGIVFIQLWERRTKDAFTLYLFIFQYALNLIWPPLFFKFHKIDFALINIIVMLTTTLLIYQRSYKSILTQILLLPYIGWLSFALFLNYEIYRLN